VPVVSAVNGVAAGIGMSFALSADIRIAARSGYFLQAFARIGLVPDGGATWILPRLVGMARAMELSMLAERLPAETALEWGMVNRVVDDEALMDEAMAMARRLAGGPASLGMIRQLYWQSLENGYSTQLKAEADTQTAAGQTQDYEEGVAAFREKRPAAFSGH
ncbi:MAG: enoyl-CoA hydratase-related protein, partial [Alphaproteobacteria bacterium]|nr:enoyl-CoA hydratase-related protein [Alphaproteobacteria bacterium]